MDRLASSFRYFTYFSFDFEMIKKRFDMIYVFLNQISSIFSFKKFYRFIGGKDQERSITHFSAILEPHIEGHVRGPSCDQFQRIICHEKLEEPFFIFNWNHPILFSQSEVMMEAMKTCPTEEAQRSSRGV